MRFFIVNANARVVHALTTCLEEVSPWIRPVQAHAFHGSLNTFLKSYNLPGASALVSPANSLSYMGGGFDRAILEVLAGPGRDYKTMEKAIQAHTARQYRGYLPCGTVHKIDLVDVCGAKSDLVAQDAHATTSSASQITTLLQAPTMVAPGPTSGQYVFDCIWNVLVAAEGEENVILPVFGAGYGGLDALVVARIMAGALGLFYAPLLPLERAAAVLIFLQKDYHQFGLALDIGEIEAHLSDEGKNFFRSSVPWPTPWPDVVRCVKMLQVDRPLLK